MNLEELFRPEHSSRMIMALFLAILFLQSGLDKIFDWNGNVGWLKSHFVSSPLKNMVPFLLAVVTMTEVGAGLLSAIGAVQLLYARTPSFALYGAQLSALSIVMLFFGQRMAKDYAGAASLTGYFIITIIAILLFRMP